MHYISNNQRGHHSLSRIKKLRNWALAGILSLSLGLFLQGIRNVLSHNYSHFDQLNIGSTLFRAGGIFAIFFFQIIRLEQTFAGSSFAIPKTTLVILKACLITANCIGFLSVILGYYVFDSRIVLYVLLLAGYFFLTFLPFIVARLFGLRLLKLVSTIDHNDRNNHKHNHTHSHSSTLSSNNNGSIHMVDKLGFITHHSEKLSIALECPIELDSKQKQLLNTVTKQSLLGIIQSACMTFGSLMLVFSVLEYLGNIQNETYSSMYPVGIFAFCVMVIVVIVCVVFSFVFVKDEYKIVCEKCHMKLFDVCQNKAIREISQKDVVNVQDQYVALGDGQ